MNDLSIACVPSGKFIMGSADNEVGRGQDEGPQHEIEISSFECMLFAVTRRLYADVVGEDPTVRWIEYARGSGQPVEHRHTAPDSLPVGWLTWLEAIKFCNFLSRSKGLPTCYVISGGADAVASNDARVEWQTDSDGYRLPTEAEWEFACRAGTRTRWSHGDEEADLSRYAWYRDNAGGLPHAVKEIWPNPHPVGEKSPNPWGLYDMHGNVYEWCYDSPRTYSSKIERCPIGDPKSIHRAIRGGSTVTPASSLRSAARNSSVRTKVSIGIGFRCVRSIG